MRNILVAILALALILAACMPAPQEQPAPTQPSSDTPPAAQEPTRTGPSPAAAPADDEPLRFANAKIQTLVQKSSAVKSLSFEIANLPDKGAWAQYYVRGTKARVDIVTPLKMDGWSADTIYLDLEAKTATARCIELAGCKKEGRVASIPFEKYDIELPLDWNDRIIYGEQTGTATFNKRQTAVIRWTEEGKTFEAYLDTFYGVVQRVAVLDLTQETPATIGGYEYREVAYNNVLDEDVTPPPLVTS